MDKRISSTSWFLSLCQVYCYRDVLLHDAALNHPGAMLLWSVLETDQNNSRIPLETFLEMTDVKYGVKLCHKKQMKLLHKLVNLLY